MWRLLLFETEFVKARGPIFIGLDEEARRTFDHDPVVFSGRRNIAIAELFSSV